MPLTNRLRDTAGRFCLDVTDLVIEHQTGDRLRVTGFYRVKPGNIDRSSSILLECAADDPRMRVISTYALCGQFHRPWALDFIRPVSWRADLVESEKAEARARIEAGDTSLNARDYPGLFERLGADLSAHETLRLEDWRRATSRRIEETLFPILPDMMSYEA